MTDVTGKHIAVPEAFFKAVLLQYQDDAGGSERYEARAWIVENRSYGFSGFEHKAAALEVSIDQLEDIISRTLDLINKGFGPFSGPLPTWKGAVLQRFRRGLVPRRLAGCIPVSV